MPGPLSLQDLCLTFPNKTCFEDFSAHLPFGSRVAIIGRNGSGKSTLLMALAGTSSSVEGQINRDPAMVIGYVPQMIEERDQLSGGQRFNAALSDALGVQPDLLLLDEPTNHLDRENRRSMMRMLQGFSGTLVVVSHDPELLDSCVDTLWHIDGGKIHVFQGQYEDYMRERRLQRASIERQLDRISREKAGMHDRLMKEQKRAAKSRAKGKKSIEQRKWPTVVSHAKAQRSEQTTGRRKALIQNRKEELHQQLQDLRLPPVIVPTFALKPGDVGYGLLLSISDGEVSYGEQAVVLQNLSLSFSSRDRVVIIGPNGSGKSTLVRAILGDPRVTRKGDWSLPKARDIGYLDQHYGNLPDEGTVLECLVARTPHWSSDQRRRHLAAFLFRSHEEISLGVGWLSGGERARLSLACIAAQTPKLLILDEITNNLDLETREHVIQVLKEFPGGMILISHDELFLNELGVEERYRI